jgi:signal transduction histidine kinase/CheY-like chemotaxis protein
MLSGIVAWLIVLAHENRRTAEAESAHQTGMLMEEIEAHKRTDAALQKAKEVAEAANVAKTRYIVGISHEFRTPLNSIFGYAQLLERGAAIPSDNAVRVIRRSSEHLANLVDGLLDISKIESGLLRLNRDKVRLVEFLDQIVDMFRLQAEAKGIRFEYQPPAHLPAFVHTDQKRLRQILINLLSNAIKYTERGRACLGVRYRSQVAEFEVSDTGVGIPEEDLDRIFQPFERGRSAAVRAIPGTGLGLTITKLLTQIMGGDLTVRSTAGSGTTFVVRMLLSEALAAGSEVSSPQKVTQYTGPRLKVLLADDNPTHLHLMEGLLQPLGFLLFTAHDGASCLEMAARHRPDLLMLDVSMPDMTGWQVAQKLRASEDFNSLKIVIVSANAHEYAPGGDKRELHDAFIMKPVDMQALLECIGNVMGLSWIYEPKLTGATDRRLPALLSSQSLHHLDDLYQLGRIGHVRGIDAKLRQIEAEDAESRPFAAHMRGLVSNFDLKQYMSILEGMRQNA